MPTPRDETADHARVAALTRLRILDGAAHPYLDAICRIAARCFDVPIAAVNLIDADTAWLKARVGLDMPCVPRRAAMCDHALALRNLVVPDLAHDPRFSDCAIVAEAPHARFYAGIPVALQDGTKIGVLCLIDTVPRPGFSAQDLRMLEELALLVEAHLQFQSMMLANAAEMEARRDAEMRLSEAYALQRTAEKAASVGHWRIDVADRSVFWSAGTARIFGRNPGARIGLADHLACYHPEDRARIAAQIEKVISGQGTRPSTNYQHRSRVVRPDGSARLVKVRGVVQRDAAGRVAAIVGFCIDISDIAQSEERMRESAALLRATLENIDQGLLMVGVDDRVCVHNRRLLDLLGLPEEAMAAAPTFAEIEHRHDAPPPRAQPARTWPTPHRRVELLEPGSGEILEVATTRLAGGGAVRTYTDVTERVRAQRRLAENEERYRVFADSLPQMVWSRRDDGEATYANAQFHRYYGPIGTDRQSRIDRYHPEDRRRLDAAWTAALAECRRAEAVGRLRRHDGAYRWHQMMITPIQRAGRVTEWLGTALDIDELMSARRSLEDKTALLAVAQQAAGAGLWEWDFASDSVRLSPESVRVLGFPAGAEPGAGATITLAQMNAAIMTEDGEQKLRRPVASREPVAVEFQVREGGGRARWVQSFGQVVFHPVTDHPTGMIGLQLDVTARKEAERQVRHDALHDALTALPNRTLFRQTLESRLDAIREGKGAPLSVLCLDLDRFKRINDTLGHRMGDLLLAAVAARLQVETRGRGLVARLGGDEFAVILDAGEAEAAAFAERLVGVIGMPFEVAGHALSVGLSIGIAVAPAHGRDPDAIFRHADLALYGVKAEGRNGARVFTAAMSERVSARQDMETELRAALVHFEGLALHYQPVLDARTRTLSGFEALMRWTHPVRGPVSPADFIPFAEENGLILPLGAWALATACAEAASWPDPVMLAVNVSAIQVRHGRLVDTVVEALAASGLPPERLELEITETALMQESGAVLETLHSLRGLGVRIALDDFGTGYSSLSYLRTFPFDRIKIDRSFVATIESPQTAAIVEAIVGLGLRLGMAVTAEGVETEARFEAVRRHGCTNVQGFLFSPAVPAAEIAALPFAPCMRGPAVAGPSPLAGAGSKAA